VKGETASGGRVQGGWFNGFLKDRQGHRWQCDHRHDYQKEATMCARRALDDESYRAEHELMPGGAS